MKTPASDKSGGSGGETMDLAARILVGWRDRLRGAADSPPRSGERGEIERLLVSVLLRVTENDASMEERRLPALAAAAARYGAGQRRERIDPGALCDELSSLRAAFWEELKQRYSATHPIAVKRILRFDRALSIVVRAALRSGYDPEDVKRAVRCAEVDSEIAHGPPPANAAAAHTGEDKPRS